MTDVILNFILRWAIVGLYARLVFRTKVVGRKNLPKGTYRLVDRRPDRSGRAGRYGGWCRRGG
ncbi:MAG: hypothetical protein WA030_00465 [Candidatus Microsaccharimonas sp.]